MAKNKSASPRLIRSFVAPFQGIQSPLTAFGGTSPGLGGTAGATQPGANFGMGSFYVFGSAGGEIYGSLLGVRQITGVIGNKAGENTAGVNDVKIGALTFYLPNTNGEYHVLVFGNSNAVSNS